MSAIPINTVFVLFCAFIGSCCPAAQEVSPPLDKRGFVLFFTGLSGSGKTTITSALIETLQSLFPTRQMTILDGDVVRTHLSKELGFSIEVRALGVLTLDSTVFSCIVCLFLILLRIATQTLLEWAGLLLRLYVMVALPSAALSRPFKRAARRHGSTLKKQVVVSSSYTFQHQWMSALLVM